jgi:hypothetical protein
MLIRWLKRVLRIHSPSRYGMTEKRYNELMKETYEEVLEGLVQSMGAFDLIPPTSNSK